MALAILSPVRVLERQVFPGLLGLQFWDVAAGVPVQDGLRVQARNSRGVVVDAVQNRSGVWHFPRLPGINSFDVARELANGAPLATLARPFVIRVSDGERRFQSIEFELTAPVEGGLFDWPHGGVTQDRRSPLGTSPIPLFSGASRLAPAGHLTVRTDLWDLGGERPAAFALLEITVAGATGLLTFLGLADERGSVSLFLPVPFVPIDGAHLPAAQRTWNVGVRVSYAPALTIDRMNGSGAPPGLDAMLLQRDVEAAVALAKRSPDSALISASLQLTEPLTLRTESEGLEPSLQSFLLVRPAP